MRIFWLTTVTAAADWEVECNSDSVKILIEPDLLERQTGSRDHRLGKLTKLYVIIYDDEKQMMTILEQPIIDNVL